MQTDFITYKQDRETSFSLDGHQYQLVLFPTSRSPWFADIRASSLFQTRQYHAMLEDAPPKGMQFWYVRITENDQVMGMLTFQIKDFNPGESLHKHAQKNLFQRIRYGFASLISVSVLCLGNTTVTGDYGFCFAPAVQLRLQTLLMMKTIDWMLTLPEFRSIRMILVKDFDSDIFQDLINSPYGRKYHAIDTQPSMIMNIPAEWNSLDDYLSALKSKYRIRAQKALSLAKALEVIELQADQIEALEAQLYELYQKVVGEVGFNLFYLAPNYFSTAKKTLGEKFRLWIYRDRGELISFYTVIEDGEILDAHFLGYDSRTNEHYKLYMNMLLRMIDHAAKNKFTTLQLSRTATEIKSSVGAKGNKVWAYLRFTNRQLNTLLPLFYSFFKPNLEWTPRHPFR
jgi:predicted N-acyltransferase